MFDSQSMNIIYMVNIFSRLINDEDIKFFRGAGEHLHTFGEGDENKQPLNSI